MTQPSDISSSHSPRPGRFIWYELMTGDADGAARFYSAVTGLKIVGSPDPATGFDYRHIIRPDGGSGGGVLSLNPDMIAGGARPCWVGYLHVADVEASAAAIVADGGHQLMPATTIPVGTFAMVTDPQGIPFYIMAPIPPADQPDAVSDVWDRTAVGHVAWNELYTTDPDAARAFYAKHFGFTYPSSLPMGSEFGDYWFIEHDGAGIGALMKKPPFVPVGSWNYYIRVADIDQAATAVSENGGQVLHGPQQVPDGDWVLNGIDPQGAAFALVGKRLTA